MSEDEKQAVRDGEFRDELKAIIAEAIHETPSKQKLNTTTVLSSLAGIMLLLGSLCYWGHVPKDIDEIKGHVTTHDSEINALRNGQSEIKERLAALKETSDDTNYRLRRTEAHEDSKRTQQ